MAENVVYHGSNPEIGAVESNPQTAVPVNITYHGIRPDIGAVESVPAVILGNVEIVGVIPI